MYLAEGRIITAMGAASFVRMLLSGVLAASPGCAGHCDTGVFAQEPGTRIAVRGSAAGAHPRLSTPVDAARACNLSRRTCSPPRHGKLTFVGTEPKNAKTSWLNEAQGLAMGVHAEQPCVFFTTRQRIYGWTAKRNGAWSVTLELPTPRWEAQIPGELTGDYDHFGDLDFQAGASVAGEHLLYVPLEARAKARTKRAPLLLVYAVRPGKQLALAGVAALEANSGSQGYSAPWVAVWPPNPAYVFTSGFDADGAAPPPQLLMYRDHDQGAGVRLSYEGSIPLVNEAAAPVSLRRVGGGEFNAAGDLFLLAHGGPGGPGLYGFSFAHHDGVVVLRQTGHSRVEIHLRRGKNEEYEGLTTGVLPVRGGEAHIHAVLANWEAWGRTGIYVKHWRVENPSPFRPDPGPRGLWPES